MESTIGNALLLLVVGMLTVFLILALVVGTGKILISITNSLYKAPEKEGNNGIENSHIALLTAVVDHVTSGRGTIDSIEKQ